MFSFYCFTKVKVRYVFFSIFVHNPFVIQQRFKVVNLVFNNELKWEHHTGYFSSQKITVS